jgi:hypothetical protein
LCEAGSFVLVLTLLVTVVAFALVAAGAFPRDWGSKLSTYIDPQRRLKA